MTHREEIMRARALIIVFNKVRGPAVPKAQQQVMIPFIPSLTLKEMIEKLRANPLSLISTLDTKDYRELHKVIILLISVMDGVKPLLSISLTELQKNLRLNSRKREDLLTCARPYLCPLLPITLMC